VLGDLFVVDVDDSAIVVEVGVGLKLPWQRSVIPLADQRLRGLPSSQRLREMEKPGLVRRRVLSTRPIAAT